MRKQKPMITLQEARNRIKYRKQFEAYNPITLIKKIVGYSLIGIGISTLPMPTGSIFLIMAGCALLSIDYKKLLNTINFYGKETGYWFYRQFRRITK